MPKMTERERLAKIEADQHNLAREADTVRRGLREHYGKLVAELPVERLTEREFRDVLSQAIRVGGGATMIALKVLPAQDDASPPDRATPSKAAGGTRRKSGAGHSAGADAGAESQAAVHP